MPRAAVAGQRRDVSDAERLATHGRASIDAIVELDPSSSKVLYNASATRLFGPAPGATAPFAWWEGVLHPDERAAVVASLRAAVQSGAESWQAEQRLRRADGSYARFRSRVHVLRRGKRAVRLIALIQDIGVRAAAVRQADAQSLDTLTGLVDRAFLQARLAEALEATRTEQIPVAAFVLDIDRFKGINEAFGHPAGDAVLRDIARRLSAIFRASDTVARLGGDEFGVVLPRATAESAMRIATRVVQSLAQPALVLGNTLSVEASIGVTVAPEHGMVAETLLRCAEIAMYSVKEAGGAASRLYAPEQEQHSPERFALLTELRQAIDRDELTLHYQPKISLATGALAGVEALARWEHPRRGLLAPDKFLAIAEETALRQQFGEWVLRTAIAQCRTWRDAGLDIPVAANLSMRSLAEPSLPEVVATLLREQAIESYRLTIEATETGLIRDRARVMTNLYLLRQLGVRLSVDDFGTGYASLTYLRELPADEFKVDRSFVKEMTTKPSDAAIVASVVHLAQYLGKVVVAEGVEDARTLAALRELGCDYGQGYHIARPMPAHELRAWAGSRGIVPEARATTDRGPILVVDDELALRHVMQLTLEARGHACVIAANAAEARLALRESRVSLVLLDVGLPGESGVELARWIVAEYPHIPVVLVTGSDDPRLPEESKRIGLAGFVAKPFSPQKLLELVDNTLNRSATSVGASPDSAS